MDRSTPGTHGLRTIEGELGSGAGAVVPAGAWAVSMNQPLGRLAFYLLAPTSDDGVLAWNFLDDLTQGGRAVSDREDALIRASIRTRSRRRRSP